jgi:hypothetical protein
MQVYRITALFAALVFAGSLAGWQAKPAVAAKPVVARTPQPARPAALPDAQLEALIRGKFGKSKIAADHFTVRVQGGVATLEGRTDVMQHKGTATRLARTAGAPSVNNRIQVSEAALNKARKNLQEGRRRAQIKRGEVRTAGR